MNSPSEPTAAVAYYRVSTARQGQSGLGLEAQQHAVKQYAARAGLGIVETFTEVETGTRKRERPVIKQAIEYARANNAVLVIAKLDRLARNVSFVSKLMESGVQFVAVDMPQANTLTIHIMAALAEYEAKLISERTKAALEAAKARGLKLGKPENLTSDAQSKGAAANRQRAISAQQQATGYARDMRKQGLGYAAIAERLNNNGFSTRQGKNYKAMTVKRMLDRAVVR
jgi:DNA invertase Pin-like site-specific DNA recombinase